MDPKDLALEEHAKLQSDMFNTLLFVSVQWYFLKTWNFEVTETSKSKSKQDLLPMEIFLKDKDTWSLGFAEKIIKFTDFSGRTWVPQCIKVSWFSERLPSVLIVTGLRSEELRNNDFKCFNNTYIVIFKKKLLTSSPSPSSAKMAKIQK